MVFEFDYVPLAIGRIDHHSSSHAATSTFTRLPPTPPTTPPCSARQSFIAARLDLASAIPAWNADPKTLANERESPLLRLPAELKLKIWHMVHEDVTIHMTATADGRVGHFICDDALSAADCTDGDAVAAADPQHLQCRCRGSLLEPPYTEAPEPEHVKQRRECTPDTDGLRRIGGLALACRETYANTRDYLWTQPNFVFPTQRLLSRFAKSHPEQLALIRNITLHTWTDSWRTMSANGFFGGCADPEAPFEWADARGVITNTLQSLRSCHLVVHVAGGDSTIWHEECKPSECVRDLDASLVKSGRKASIRCKVTAAVESSRYGPGAKGSWVTYDQVKGLAQVPPVIRERNVDVLQELERGLPQGWQHAWWVSLEERDHGQEAAGPKPWPIVYNHAY